MTWPSLRAVITDDRGDPADVQRLEEAGLTVLVAPVDADEAEPQRRKGGLPAAD